jgi:hypothetical protein
MQYTTFQYPHVEFRNETMYYLNTAQENPGLSSLWQAKNNYSDSMDVLFAAVFQQKSQYQPTGSDPWGNPLIPVYEYLNDITLSDPTAWIDIDSSDVAYSSYYGIPMADVSDYDGAYAGTWNFTMQSSYLYLDCLPLSFETMGDIASELAQLNVNVSALPTSIGGSLRMGMTPPTRTSTTGNLTFISSCSAQTTEDGDPTYAYTVCSLTQDFVNSAVTCADTNCTVISIQKQPGPLPVEIMDFMPEFIKASDTGLVAYPTIGDTPYSITELYILDPTAATQPGAGTNCNLKDIADDAPSFTQSLSFLLNTYYSTGFTHDFTVGSVFPNDTVTLWNSTSNTDYAVSITLPTYALHTYQSDISPFLFGINWEFIAIYEFCALTLLMIGIAGVLLESRTTAPDVLGWVSSVARQSKYIKLPKIEGEGPMSGAERAKRLGETRVMMQDVKGKIVLGSVTEGAERLKRGQLYR